MSGARVLPGFRPTLTFALLYLAALVAVPLVLCFAKAMTLTWAEFWAAAGNERARAAYLLTFGTSLAAASINLVVGSIIAWVLVRYDFPLKRWFDSLIDLPFALPTAVAGLVYSDLYIANGWFGRFLVPLGVHGAYSRLGIVLVLTFISLPFVVRTLQPVLESLDVELEEAAAALGASRLQTVWRVLLPNVLPALITGFALSVARALGEYGSVIFISGNMPFATEIAPVLIVARLEEFRYAEATALAVVLLSVSFAMLALINVLERWCRRHDG